MATCNLNNQVTVTFTNDLAAAQVVGKITGFSGLDGEAADIDVTTFDSTFKEFCQGLPDAGNISMDFVRDFDDAGQAAMLDALENQEERVMVITFPVGTINTITLNVYVKSFTVDASSIEEVVRGTANMKITGAPVYSAVP
jgi:hypothetical protein